MYWYETDQLPSSFTAVDVEMGISRYINSSTRVCVMFKRKTGGLLHHVGYLAIESLTKLNFHILSLCYDFFKSIFMWYFIAELAYRYTCTCIKHVHTVIEATHRVGPHSVLHRINLSL